MRGSYGIDAPYAPALIGALGVMELALAIMSRHAWTFLAPAFIFSILAVYLHTTRRGKFAVWAELLDALHLQGHERILDMGCGRGAVLMMAAQHLTTGRAVGIDLWRSADQSGNSVAAARRNALAEGVADRVALHTADITALPFVDDSFDVVVSSLAIHNISAREARRSAIKEAARVLRPGGRLLIADIRATREYEAQLAALDITDIARRSLGLRFWWGGPWARTWLVTATKSQP